HMDFTSDKVLLSHAIDELYSMGEYNSFDYTSIMRELLDHVDLDEEPEDTIVRVIMIYTRSNVVPSKPEPELHNALYMSGKFFFDCVYIHNKAGEVPGKIKPQHVYDRLTEFEDARNPSYYYELTRVLKKYQTAMSELLIHPLLRHPQEEKPTIMPPPPNVQQEIEEQQRLSKAQRTNSISKLSNQQQQQLQQQQQYQQQQQQQLKLQQEQQHQQHVQHIQQIQQKQQQQQQHPPTSQRQQSPLPTEDIRPTQSDLVPFAQQALMAANSGSVGSPNQRPFQTNYTGTGSSSPSLSLGPLVTQKSPTPVPQPRPSPSNHGSTRDLTTSPKANRPTPPVSRQGSMAPSDSRTTPSSTSNGEPGADAENAILI
ncbi:hypothetical protein BGZ83_012180, partial [Gryganskiella cystojenkinii]